MDERERLKALKIPEALKGKKIVMSAEMFVYQIGEIIFNFMCIENPTWAKLDEEARELVIKQYVIGCLGEMYERNINSKPNDPEDIQ